MPDIEEKEQKAGTEDTEQTAEDKPRKKTNLDPGGELNNKVREFCRLWALYGRDEARRRSGYSDSWLWNLERDSRVLAMVQALRTDQDPEAAINNAELVKLCFRIAKRKDAPHQAISTALEILDRRIGNKQRPDQPRVSAGLPKVRE